MSGTAVAATIAEHAPTGIIGGLVVWLGTVVRDWLKGRKPVEDGAATVVSSFSTLTDQLQAEIALQAIQIEKLRANEHRLRGNMQKLIAYGELMIRWAGKLEDQIREAGMEPPPRPELPSLS